MKTKDFFKRDWAIICLIVLPFLVVWLYWNQIPGRIPLHWNLSGEIDRFDSKIPGIFYIPALNLALYFLFLILPKFDPLKKNYPLFEKTYQTIKFSIIALMSLLSFIVTLSSTGLKIDIMYWVIVPIIILFLIMGNSFGTLRPNWFIGIRVPWTMMNENVWRSTHRLAGKIWVWGSILMLVLVFFLPSDLIKYGFWIYLAIIFFWPVIFSWREYKKENALQK